MQTKIWNVYRDYPSLSINTQKYTPSATARSLNAAQGLGRSNMSKTTVHILSLCFIMLTGTSLWAQKFLEKDFYENVDGISIVSDEIFEIHIATRDSDHISVKTMIDGETFESALLTTKIVDKQLYIGTSKTPDYHPFNDKLAAHKVLSIAIYLEIPHHLNLNIYSTLASLDAIGSYGQVRVDLGRGGCRLDAFSFRESAIINTLSGSIRIEVDHANLIAQSRNGNVVIPTNLTGTQTMSLKSIDGDIVVYKSL